MAFQFQPRSKFALLAVEHVYSELPEPEVQLTDGTWALSGVPLPDLGIWTEWIGSIGVRRLKTANLILLRQEAAENPQIVDAVHQRLDDDLTRLFYLLQLSSVVEYEGAELLLGSSVDGQPQIRQISELHKFYPSKGYTRIPCTVDRMNEAIQLREGLKQMETVPAAGFIRGMNALTDGLMRNNGQDRLHQFVRGLEALIVPDIGQTKKQFVHRCQTFAVASPVAAQVLGEAFDMRSDTEHLQDWERALHTYPVGERDDVAWLPSYSFSS